MEQRQSERQGRSRSRRKTGEAGPVATPYIHLRNPFVPQEAYSADEIAAIHEGALRVLEELGIRVLLDEARALYRAGGALVDETSQMVRIGREMVSAALATAPRSIRLRAANPEREQDYTLGSMLFMAGAGCPNAFDKERGRRPGDLKSYLETLRLQQSFDVIHMHGPSVEPQDVAIHLRHYEMMRGQLENCDKPLFAYARGRQQVEESFELIRLARGLDEAAFADGVWATTVINSNSPRQLDLPMSRGIIDFARHGQMSIITPFCLAGAMAPITVSGALMLQHAEALAGITLAQLAKAGAPVSYGGFLSNVDMKSGSPAFGTPEHIRACIGSGQLARYIGLPWRSATGAASNTADAQAATETVMALWGAVLGGATVTVHSAGWLEGGLTLGYEKFILDIEALQTVAELVRKDPADEAALGFDAIKEVQPGGHFFSTAHTMERYQTAFYQPLVADLSNHGSWTEAGALRADERATAIWKQKLADFVPPASSEGVADRIADFIEQRSAAGGAKPED
ncbi:trimethylamine methyltransferase family protein [Xinfangfangia sp. CPCC 101601]|uniref:Methyltransferase n=1 Tax=Pseudogemmobacter lacusdianii TaxID=3069608 RepID=A0ABU0W2A9_9RHOB|nr:trimethylamine methyltransferase family protein [Xinfangfangia sp. CPCC 101601]MDQ2067918.1 trimethylamine methyltransferase family protein [Xinfangfangia sp. CPCC 101601]